MKKALRVNELMTPQRINKFSQFFRNANLEQIGYLGQFYERELKPLLSQKQMICYTYSQALIELIEVIEVKRTQPRVLQFFPELDRIAEEVAKAVIFPTKEDQFDELDSSFEEELQQKYVQVKDKSREIIKKDSKEKNPKKNKQDCFKATDNSHNQQCLGCTQFFYEGRNFVTKEIQRTDVMVLPSVKKLKMYEQQLVRNISGLINQRGGVILFGCTVNKGQYIAKGELVSEGLKESIPQQIQEIFQFFHPKLTFSANAHLSFVPIALSDEPEQKMKEMKVGEKHFKEGYFVTRLRVWNNHPYQLILNEKGGNLYLSQCVSGQYNHLETKELSFRQINRLLKKKFKQNYISLDLSKESNLMQIDRSHFFSDHKCLQPYAGIKITTDRRVDNSEENPYSLETKYTYLSIVSLNKVPQSKAISFLVSQKITNFQFCTAFDPKMVPNNQIQILFHDTSPYKIQQIITRIQHNTYKPTFLILDHSIKLGKHLSQKQFEELQIFILDLNEEQNLEYYEFVDRRIREGILECNSKVSVFFLYMRLRMKTFPGVKLIKLDPTRRNQIKLIYPRPQL